MSALHTGTAQSVDATFQAAEWPFYWLTRASDRYLQQLEVALKSIGLDIPRWRVLMQLNETKVASVSTLAEHAIVKLPTMTKIVQRMQHEGLVRCWARQSDARVTDVALTDAGLRAREKAFIEAQSIYRQAFSGISQQQIADLVTQLDDLFNRLESGMPKRRSARAARTGHFGG